MLTDYYQILGIEQDASDMEIKQAYRRKVKDTHPDVLKTAKAFDDFLLVNEAYEILIHHNTRDIYNEDYKTNHDPMIYESYFNWINIARDRALKHSQMTLEEFLKTEFYKQTHPTPYVLNLVGLIMGIALLVGGIGLLFILEEQKVLSAVLFFTLMPTGIFLLMQSNSGLKALKKYH